MPSRQECLAPQPTPANLERKACLFGPSGWLKARRARSHRGFLESSPSLGRIRGSLHPSSHTDRMGSSQMSHLANCVDAGLEKIEPVCPAVIRLVFSSSEKEPLFCRLLFSPRLTGPSTLPPHQQDRPGDGPTAIAPVPLLSQFAEPCGQAEPYLLAVFRLLRRVAFLLMN